MRPESPDRHTPSRAAPFRFEDDPSLSTGASRSPAPDGVVENPLVARNWPQPSFRRKPESIVEQNDTTPAFHLPVIDGNQSENKKQRQNKWIPAFAGMTNKAAPLRKVRSRPRTGTGACPLRPPPWLVPFTESRKQGFSTILSRGDWLVGALQEESYFSSLLGRPPTPNNENRTFSTAP